MVIKLIKAGIDTKTYSSKCYNCKAIMEAHEDDLNVETCPREGFEFAHETCMTCGKRVVFYKDKDKK